MLVVLELLHEKNTKMRQKKEFTTKHCMLKATNLHQTKKNTPALLLMHETFRRSDSFQLSV